MPAWYRRETHGAGGKFIRRPCTYCRTYTSHTTSTCPSEDAKADRRVKAARRRAVRALKTEAR